MLRKSVMWFHIDQDLNFKKKKKKKKKKLQLSQEDQTHPSRSKASLRDYVLFLLCQQVLATASLYAL